MSQSLYPSKILKYETYIFFDEKGYIPFYSGVHFTCYDRMSRK